MVFANYKSLSIFERSMNWIFSFKLCLSVFLYFYTVYLLLWDSQDAKKKTCFKNLVVSNFSHQSRAISNILLSWTFCLVQWKLEIAGLHCNSFQSSTLNFLQYEIHYALFQIFKQYFKWYSLMKDLDYRRFNCSHC